MTKLDFSIFCFIMCFPIIFTYIISKFDMNILYSVSLGIISTILIIMLFVNQHVILSAEINKLEHKLKRY